MKILKNNMYMLRHLWRASPQAVLLYIIAEILMQFGGIVFTIILMPFIVRAIENNMDINRIILMILVYCIYSGLTILFNAWFHHTYQPKSEVVIQEYFVSMIYKKAVECDLSCYENPDFYDKYTRANAEIMSRGSSILMNIAYIISSIVNIIICAAVILRWEPIAIPIVLVCAVGSMLIDRKRSELNFESYKKTTPYNRQTDYVQRTLYLADYAKEMRLGNIFSPLMGYYDIAVDKLLKITRRYSAKIGILRGIREIFMSIGTFLGLHVIIIYRYIQSRAYGLSDLVAVLNAANMLQGRIYSFAYIFSEFMDNGLYAENIRTFIEYEPKIKEDENAEKVKKGANDLELRNVSFKYEGKEEYVLKNININIPHGKKIALVGHNGAGKSTLVKLLMRLYDVSDGEICLDGRDIREYRLSEYRRIYAAIFQDFKIFATSVTENVLLHPAENEEDMQRAVQALKDSGLYSKIEAVGMDTMLTKEFDDNGMLMSGGEFQKIAVARVFAKKDSSIAILDEPSSALDPISEYEIFENMMKACKDKTIIFISHRLSSAVLADRIYMLENGEVIEEGTHHELMEKNGKYAEMFRMQSEQYREEED